MRTDCFAMSPAEALALAGRVGLLHIAASTPEGPLLRTVDGVVHDGALCFHGGDHGQKLGLVGAEVMIAVEQVVAHLPSWFFDERRACPATTYYRSVHAWGRVERVEPRRDKAAILQALMERYQPEGRHVPVDADDPLYTAVVDNLLVARVRPTRIVGKAKLGQHKGKKTIGRALAGLWQRGQAGDLTALRTIREAHPARPVPEWMQGPAGVRFEVAPDEREVGQAVALVRDAYWNEGVSEASIRTAHLASDAWIVGHDSTGAVVATARATSDDTKAAMIFDVAIAASLRGQGVGQALMSLLMQHPRLRCVSRVGLQTRDAQGFYAKLGFGPYTPRHSQLVRPLDPLSMGTPRASRSTVPAPARTGALPRP